MFITMVAVALLPVPADTKPVAEAPRYFFILYAGQSVPFRARTAHTWATGVKTVGGQVVETITVSWLPADANVQPLRLRPVTGRNWSLEDTLAIMASNHCNISVWGPYEVGEERWKKAQEHRNYLESGAVRYRAVDSFNLNKEIVNCVHAVTYAHPVLQTRIQPVIRVGEPGTSRLAGMYLRAGSWPGYPETHDWILTAIGVDQYPNLYRRTPGEHIPRIRR
jgi:hypothetical protein